jgi:type II secretory pathway component GspD/PulD (secretin)
MGFLFKSERNSNDRRELLIFVSPKIIRDTVSAGR